MKTIKWMMGLFVCFVFTLMSMVASSPAADVQDNQVGRIYYIDGELLRYIPEDNDWVAVVKDAPFGEEDTFFSGSRGMTEMVVPNGSWIRIGNNTQIQFIALDPDLSEVDVASGVARFYNKGTDTVIKATSPFGYVLADPGTVFDFYVGESSVEVVAVKGAVSFVHSEDNARYNVAAGSPSILADRKMVSSGDGTVDLAWDRWNETRERVWSAKLGVKGRSAEYLPPSLRYDSHCLDEHGRWDMVHYQGGEYWFWRPTGVYAGWSPFTVGVWTEWCGDQTWIPAEPFGYVTHHYGNWVFIGDFWYWAPPVVSVRVGFPLLDIGFYWYPGRVSWIHRGLYVGWVPLAPHETYYSHHNWGGPHHRVMKDYDAVQVNVRVESLSNSKRAVIIRQDKFHGVENYRDVRVVNVHPTIINKYNAAPVVNNTVINNYETNSQRHKYANATVLEKPDNAVINRVRQNETIISQGRKENAESVRQQVKSVKEGKVNQEVRIVAPRVTDKTTPVRDVTRSEPGMNPKQTETKTGAGMTTETRTGETGRSKEQSGQSITQPERVDTIRPIQQEKGVTQSDRVVPTTPTQQEKTVIQPRSTAPAAPTQQNRTVSQPDRGAQSTTTESGMDRLQKVVKSESATKEVRTQEKATQKKSGETSERPKIVKSGEEEQLER